MSLAAIAQPQVSTSNAPSGAGEELFRQHNQGQIGAEDHQTMNAILVASWCSRYSPSNVPQAGGLDTYIGNRLAGRLARDSQMASRLGTWVKAANLIIYDNTREISHLRWARGLLVEKSLKSEISKIDDALRRFESWQAPQIFALALRVQKMDSDEARSNLKGGNH